MSTDASERYWRTPLDAATIPRLTGKIHILEERCKGCAFCVDFCPCDVLARSNRFNSKGYHPPDVPHQDKCVACKFCELICPEFAIAIEELTVQGEEVAHAS